MASRVVTPDTASLSSAHRSQPSLHGRPNTQVFTLDTFSSADFIVKDFVESLSDAAAPARRSAPANAGSHVSNTASSSQAFDPKPLIRTFEYALARLKTLSEDLQEREDELSASVRRAEGQHNSNIKSREQELERAIASFRRLERTLDGDGDGEADDGGNAAMRIGERLEELDRQRQRAQDAKFILQCWVEVSERGELTSLDDVRKMGGGEGKVRCAHIARQLLKISQRLDSTTTSASASSPHDHTPKLNGNGNGNGNGHGGPWHHTREIIEKFLEMLEKDLLKSFDDFYRRQNFDGMRECALALHDFSDGNSVISLFVNQHQFFIDRSQLVTEELTSDNDAWERLADPDTEPPGVEPSLQSLVDEVKVVVQEESFIIKRAFPFENEVLARFLQRVFQQSIQQRLEMVLNKADDVSSLAFLRSLQASRSYIALLVEDLKTHGLTEHPDPCTPSIAAVLDQQLDELYIPYFTGTSYIEREKRSLSELFEGLLFKFALYHSRRRRVQIHSNSYLSAISARSKEFLSSARDAYMERLDSADLQPGQKATLLRVAGLGKEKDATPGASSADVVTDEDGQLSLPFTKRMLKWLAEAVGRSLELSTSLETPKEIRELLHLLLSNVGEIYLETALDAATDAATSAEQSSKSEPDLSYITDLRAAISVLHLIQTTCTLLLLPLAATNRSLHRDLTKQSESFVERMESKIDGILQKTLDAALLWTAKLLATQKKTDFRPKDETALQLDQLQTGTCQAVYAFLSRLHSRLSSTLSGRVLEQVSLELAIGFRTLLLQHFKSFQVSLTGALVVSKDMTLYIELLKSWDVGGEEGFEGSLEVLTEVANVFVLGSEALRDRIMTQGGKGWSGGDLRAYVLRREDSGSVGVLSLLGGL
ncbi:related to exocyst complex 100 kDa component [Ramularia collo-cygni]|uniref:Related to exocyst complex 100 kDa component n=1 Tax=Ramularia collo-cygni TaxID=112498 RepID=A0A2D3VHK5_9PEZI|nr:related to exocyst complex 100 kDa component [Ramularia collo-cygni]CZT24812.1 related to exocyst complex 100 kDa component [Ramularia collo-cygni]